MPLQPSLDFGDPCYSLNSTYYVLNCGYSGAFEALNFMYGGSLALPIAGGDDNLTGSLRMFNQGEFTDGVPPTDISMDDMGYIYVPEGCTDPENTCRLHVALHGCQQGM